MPLEVRIGGIPAVADCHNFDIPTWHGTLVVTLPHFPAFVPMEATILFPPPGLHEGRGCGGHRSKGQVQAEQLPSAH